MHGQTVLSKSTIYMCLNEKCADKYRMEENEKSKLENIERKREEANWIFYIFKKIDKFYSKLCVIRTD